MRKISSLAHDSLGNPAGITVQCPVSLLADILVIARSIEDVTHLCGTKAERPHLWILLKLLSFHNVPDFSVSENSQIF